MGLSIYYSGMLRRGQLPRLIDEVTDICDGLYWPYKIIKPSDDLPVEGLTFTMPGAEPVWLTFLDDGRLSSPEHIALDQKAKQLGRCLCADITLQTVVQYAGPEAHMRMIRMLRYISYKYFETFHLMDESEYWESGNEEKCRDWFIMFNLWMNNVKAEHAQNGVDNSVNYPQLNRMILKGV